MGHDVGECIGKTLSVDARTHPSSASSLLYIQASCHRGELRLDGQFSPVGSTSRIKGTRCWTSGSVGSTGFMLGLEAIGKSKLTPHDQSMDMNETLSMEKNQALLPLHETTITTTILLLLLLPPKNTLRLRFSQLLVPPQLWLNYMDINQNRIGIPNRYILCRLERRWTVQ